MVVKPLLVKHIIGGSILALDPLSGGIMLVQVFGQVSHKSEPVVSRVVKVYVEHSLWRQLRLDLFSTLLKFVSSLTLFSLS